MSRKEKLAFGSFGQNSEIELPCLNINNRHLIHIGEDTTILKGARIQLYPDLAEKEPHIHIGNHCYIGYNVTILAGDDVTIEDGVLFASNVIVASENHGMNPEQDVYYMDQPLTGAPVRIGEGTWIGERVAVLAGVTIGKKCVIGTGSVVTKSVPDYSIAVGSPAKVVKTYDFEQKRWIKVTENG